MLNAYHRWPADSRYEVCAFLVRLCSNEPLPGACPGHLIICTAVHRRFCYRVSWCHTSKSEIFLRISFTGYGELHATLFLPDYRLKRHSPGGPIHGGIVLNTTLCLRIRNGYREKNFKISAFFILKYVLLSDSLPASIAISFAETQHYL